MLIRVLDSFLINQIAAGEVIERPYSVVKELVENSIDANSTSIVVEAKEGGLSYIRVTDNGDGIEESDCILSFESHATSKITSGSDLEKVSSLGFRGEALASIAAVSQVEMFSCSKEAEMGTNILCHGGKIISKKGYGCPKGTSIIVRNLFYNVPARLKFLKSTRAEASGIAELMSRLILSRPQVSFKYIYDDKTVFTSPGDSSLLSAITGVYGVHIKNEVIKIQKDDKSKGISLYGYVGKSSIARKNRNHQTFFVNGRYVKNYMLSSCIGEAFRSYLPTNHFPWAVLSISIPYETVDVNVHPAKTQVRFKDERHVYQTIYKWLREALDKDNTFKGTDGEASEMIESSSILKITNPILYDYPFSSIEKVAEEKVVLEVTVQEYNPSDPTEAIKLDSIAVKDIRLIGSAFNTYLIAQGENDMYLLDQHAAHERMIYEKFKDELAFKRVIVQLLLSPLIIEIREAEQSNLAELIAAMENLGFDIAMFDLRSVAIRGIPSLLSGVDVTDFFRALTDVMHLNPYADHDFRLEQIIKLSCKKAVKASNPLSNIEMLYILDSIIKKRIPSTCPHGRPIIVSISKNELEIRFKRK